MSAAAAGVVDPDIDVPTRPVYQAIADGLAANGVTAAFGLMGEDTADLVTDFDRVGISYVAARHENIALNMADGYAAQAGLGVAVLSRGPGVTNAATALGTAAKRRSPVLIITGEVATGAWGSAGSLKRVDQAGLCRLLGVEYRTAAEPSAVASAFEEAVTLARSGQPTLLAVPVDVMIGSTSTLPQAVAPPAAPDPPSLTPAQVDEAVAILRGGRRPLILAGRGAVLSDARRPLEELAATIGAIVGTTMQAKDLFRGSPFDIGVVGGFANPAGRELLAEVDRVLVFGARLSEFTSSHGRLFRDTPIVQFDTAPKPPAAGVEVSAQFVADAGTAARQLDEALASLDAAPAERPFHTPEVAVRVARCHRFEEADRSRPGAIDPRVVVAMLDEILPPDRVIHTDGGHCSGFPAMHMRVSGAGRYLWYDGIGAIGMGLGTAVGAAVARPHLPLVFFAGDGSLSMAMGDLETVARHGIAMVIVVINDAAYGAERHLLDLAGHPHHHSVFGDIDFAALARTLGMEGATVRSPDDLRELAPSLREPRTSPIVIDCKVAGEIRARWLEEL